MSADRTHVKPDQHLMFSAVSRRPKVTFPSAEASVTADLAQWTIEGKGGLCDAFHVFG